MREPKFPRYLALWVPNWELTSLVVEAPPDACAAVISHSRVQVVTPAASARGVAPGMSQVMAQYLCPELLNFPPDKDRQALAFEAIMQVLEDLAVSVVAIRPGLACAPSHGPAKWSGGEGLLVAEIIEQVALQTGAECQVGIANTLPGSLLAAREGIIVPSSQTMKFIDAQPLTALIQDLPAGLRKQVESELPILASLGITRVGQFRKLGADPVATRFGKVGEIIWQLASGRGIDISSSPRQEGEIFQEVELDPPASTADEAMMAIRQVSNALADTLVSKGLYSSTIRIHLERADGRVVERTWTLLDASSPTQIGKRIFWQMAALSPAEMEVGFTSDPGPTSDHGLESIRVIALHPHRVPEVDPLWGGKHNLRKAARAIEEVQSLLGEDAAVIPSVHGGFDPRSRVSFHSWGGVAPTLPPREGPWEGGVSSPPIVLFSKPPPALLMGDKPDGTVGRIWVNKRGELTGTPLHLLVQEDHPELPSGDHRVAEVERVWVVGGRWWHPEQEDHRRRCYLRLVRQNGSDVLLLQKGHECWVEGVYHSRKTGWLDSMKEDRWRNSTSVTER